MQTARLLFTSHWQSRLPPVYLNSFLLDANETTSVISCESKNVIFPAEQNNVPEIIVDAGMKNGKV